MILSKITTASRFFKSYLEKTAYSFSGHDVQYVARVDCTLSVIELEQQVIISDGLLLDFCTSQWLAIKSYVSTQYVLAS